MIASWWWLDHGDLFSTGVFKLDVLDAHETQLLHRWLTFGCVLEAECLDGSGHLRTGVHATHVGGLMEVATRVTVRRTIHGGDAATRHREEAEEQLSERRARVSVCLLFKGKLRRKARRTAHEHSQSLQCSFGSKCRL